jgi:hypothetical protein
MSKKKDLEDFDRFMDFIKDNPDVRDMILNALNKAMRKDTNNPYIFDPMTDGNAERPTPRQSLTLQRLMLKTNKESN